MPATSYRVWVLNRPRMTWAVRQTVDDRAELERLVAGLRAEGRRVRVEEFRRKAEPLRVLPPVVGSATRAHRDAVAESMVELFDARKRYKSPG